MVAFRLYNVFAVALLVTVLLGTGGAYGYVIDGQLNDWGVTPFAHWTPSAGIVSVVDNWGEKAGQTGSYPYGGATYAAGIVGSGANMGKVYLNPTWSLADAAIGLPQNGPSHLSGGTLIAQAAAVYADAGVLEPNGSHTYVIEMGLPIDWSLLLGDPSHVSLQFHYTMGCGNDKLEWGPQVINTPEPSVLALMISGVGAALLRGRGGRRIVMGI